MKGYTLDLNAPEGQTVMEVEGVGIQGNIVPPQWLQHLKTPAGKPNAIAALILSDIVYWYRPIMPRDETTGQALPPRKKFKADLLQRSYQSYADMYGFSKAQVKAAFRTLQDVGAISLEFRTLHNNGLTLSNVMFIRLHPGVVKNITREISPPDNPGSDTMVDIDDDYQPEIDGPVSKNTPPLYQNFGGGDIKFMHTNTETTQRLQQHHEPPENFETEKSIGVDTDSGGGLIDYQSQEKVQPDDLSEVFAAYQNNISQISPILADEIKDLVKEFGFQFVLDAIRIAVKANVRSLKYIRGICRRRQEQGANWKETRESSSPGKNGQKVIVINGKEYPLFNNNGDKIIRNPETGAVLRTIPAGASA